MTSSKTKSKPVSDSNSGSPKLSKTTFELIFLVVIIAAIVIVFLQSPFSPFSSSSSSEDSPLLASSPPSTSTTQRDSTPPPIASPTPKPIPHGPIDFSVSQSDKTKPLIGKGLIDPYDPDPNGLQTVSISVKDEQPVTKVTAFLKTDNAISEPVSFKLISGSPTDGTWQGSWHISDTYLFTYNLVINATSSRGESVVEITLR